MTEVTDTMSPIIELMYSQMRMEQENEVMKAIQSIGVNVDKERLLQALEDAKAFWCEGYDAGRRGKPAWISVKERLPELHQPVLVYSKRFDYPGGDIAPDKRVPLYGDVEVWVSEYKTWKGKVTHWMPLPEPPKEET